MRRAPIRSAPAVPHDGTRLFIQATRPQALEAAWDRVRANDGAAGGDRMTCAAFGLLSRNRLDELHQELVSGRYHPGPVRHVEIDKPSGGKRRLTIPCVRDRIAQTAVTQTLVPLLEAEFEDVSFGYRPGRSVKQALQRVYQLRRAGYVHTLDADITACFDSVPHDRLIERLLVSVSQSPLTDLIELWLETGADHGRGLPQGSPLSPLLANLFLDQLDEALMETPMRIVRYADDFLVMAKDLAGAEKARKLVETTLHDLGLSLHPQKTALRDYDDTVRFLGTEFVRSLVLTGGDDTVPMGETEALLARIAQLDREQQEQRDKDAAQRHDERAVGHDRGVSTLYVTQKGRRIDLQNHSFAVRETHPAPDGSPDVETLAVLHPSLIDRIEVGNRSDISLDAMRNALAHGVEVALVNGFGETIGTLTGPLPQRATRHLAQARHALDPDLRLALACQFVEGRLKNQRALLRRINQRRGLAEVDKLATRLGRVMRKLAICRDVHAVMGVEGEATALYWRGFSALLMHGWSLPARKRRPAPDAVNAALGLASAILERDTRSVLLAAGLHPGFGFLHAVRDGGDSLVFDMMEVFRTPLADGAVLEAFNTRVLRAEHFRKFEGGKRLTAEGQRALIRVYERRAGGLVRSPGGDRVTWRRLMLEQSRALSRFLDGGPRFEPFVADY